MKKRRKKKQKQNKTKRSIRPVLLILFTILMTISGITVGLLELYKYLNRSPYLRIKKVIVLSHEDQLRRYVMGVLKPQARYMNIIFFDADEIKKRIEMHPWIKSADIKKEFPDTLIINIKKEIPRALVSLGNDLFYVDTDGYMFKKVRHGEHIDLPVITGLMPNDENFKKRIKKAIKILHTFKETDHYASKISEVYITRYGNVHLYLYNKPIEVIVSHDIDGMDKREVSKKLQSLKKVLNYFSNYAQIRPTFIDLDSIKNGAIIGLSK